MTEAHSTAGSAPPPAPRAAAGLRRSVPATSTRHLRNLTTITVLPPVEPPTGFADLGVPDAHRRRPRRGRLRPAVHDPDRGDPGGDAGPRRVRPGPHRVRQDAGLRRPDARPHPRRGRADAPARPRARADPRARRAGRRGARAGRHPRRAARSSPSTAGPAGHHQIDELRDGRRDRRRHAAAPDRPAEVGRGLAGRRRRRRARRGRPDGRRRLHAAGRVDPAPLHGRGRRRCCSRRRSTATSAT